MKTQKIIAAMIIALVTTSSVGATPIYRGNSPQPIQLTAIQKLHAAQLAARNAAARALTLQMQQAAVIQTASSTPVLP